MDQFPRLLSEAGENFSRCHEELELLLSDIYWLKGSPCCEWCLQSLAHVLSQKNRGDEASISAQ